MKILLSGLPGRSELTFCKNTTVLLMVCACFIMGCKTNHIQQEEIANLDDVKQNNICPDPSRPDCYPPPPTSCGAQPVGRQLPFIVEKSRERISSRNYNQTWQPNYWPDSSYAATLIIPDERYLALPFVAQPQQSAWRLGWVVSPNSGTAVNASISRCPGDFRPNSGDRCHVVTSPNGAITAIVGVSNLACQLTEGEIYYLNIRNNDGNGNSTCNFRECKLVARPTQLQARLLQP